MKIEHLEKNKIPKVDLKTILHFSCFEVHKLKSETFPSPMLTSIVTAANSLVIVTPACSLCLSTQLFI